MILDTEEKNRYSRHLSLLEIGEAGQEKLKNARVLIVGAGGLGCPAALYLVAAGIGTVGLIDPDRVDVTNLQRQILYRTDDVGEFKVKIAHRQLCALNPRVKILAYPFALDVTNAKNIIQDYDIVLDATDNFVARYLVSDACFLLGKPNIFASVTRFEGRLSVFCPGGPCYRCLFPGPPEEVFLNCATEGILGAVPGVVGTMQALETVKVVLSLKTVLTSSIVLFDLMGLQFRKIAIERNPECALCGPNATIKQLGTVLLGCISAPEITVTELSKLMKQRKTFRLIDVREREDFEKGSIPGSLSIPLRVILEGGYLPSKDEPHILFCKSGHRSQRAAQKLLEMETGEIASLKGGIEAWHGLDASQR